MRLKKLYLTYAISILILGLAGFFLTHAKSALISGVASAVIMAALSFIAEKNQITIWISRIINLLLIGAFTWRSNIALSALAAGATEKLIPGILITLMALISVVVFAVSVLKPKNLP